MLAAIGADLDVTRRLGELPIAQQQVVQIAVAVGGGARIIVFDEPTSSLSQVEAERLYALIAQLKSRGVTCIYVSHRMAEVYRLCDTITVLRDGRHVATKPAAELSEPELVQLMIGRPVAAYFGRHSRRRDCRAARTRGAAARRTPFVRWPLRGRLVLRARGRNRRARGTRRRRAIGCRRDDLRRTEADGRTRARFRGRDARVSSPADAIRLGIALVPEDRKRQGLVLSESGRRNTSLPHCSAGFRRLTWLKQSEERALVERHFHMLRVRAPDIDAPVAGLSGGNQQKIVLARWLAANAKVLILDEPTRGVDVGAKAEIHALIGELAAKGAGVLLISSELPELLSLSTRILVLRGGRLVGEMPARDATQDGLLRLMAGIG